MFSEHGVGTEDLPWIERDQFVYYVEMERQLGDPSDWPSFREGVISALEAAFGWEPTGDGDVLARRLDVLDVVRGAHDPVAEWDAFFEALWRARGSLT